MTYKNRHPWMTEQLRNKITETNTIYFSTLQQPENTDLIDRYKRIRNDLNSALKNTEIQYHGNQLELHKNDIAKTWKIMKNIIGKEIINSNRTLSISIDGEITTDMNTIVSEFNFFFVDIGPRLPKDISCNVNPLTYVNTIPKTVWSWQKLLSMKYY